MKTLLLSILICTLLHTYLSEKCHPNDKKVLLQIKQHFGNPYHLTSWNPSSDCCSWYCVRCHPTTHRITSLTIFSGQLSGPIPSAVGDLPFLQTLEFHRLTNVTGPIPPAIARLKSLEYLRLSWLNLTGPVPQFLSQLKNLNTIELSVNSLSGSIPSSLASLTNLQEIMLDRNKLTGPIPASFGYFKGKVPSLYLSRNQLLGKIPASLGKLDFETIDFSRNRLEGDASMLFGPKKTTWKIDLSRNLLEFDLSKVVFPPSLDVSHNKIYGSIPKGAAGMRMQYLNVSYNRLCGRIPVGGRLQEFGYSAYFHNRCLCGAPMPACK